MVADNPNRKFTYVEGDVDDLRLTAHDRVLLVQRGNRFLAQVDRVVLADGTHIVFASDKAVGIEHEITAPVECG